MLLGIILVLAGIGLICSGIYGLYKGEESPATMMWLIIVGVAIELAAVK